MEPMRVRGVPLRTMYPRTAKEERVPILFEIDVAELVIEEERPPFELCIVLDTSGSMAGRKMRDAKAAVQTAIAALAEGDILHVVAYSDSVRTVLTQGTRARERELRAAVEDISAGGQTNISAALSSAMNLLANSGEGGGSKRIFLISDGLPSSGIQTHDGLQGIARDARQSGINISTFGIGADIDEEIMKGIATSGRGAYSFLRETIIRQTIEGAMSTLLRTVGREASIQVQSIAPVGRITSIHRSLEGDDHGELETRPAQGPGDVAAGVGAGSGGEVWIGDLRSGSRKQSLIEISLSAPDGAQDGELIPVVTFELRYMSTSSNQEIRVPGVVTAAVGSDGADVPRVLVADEMQRLDPQQHEFRRLIQAGARHDAMQLQRNVIARLEVLQEMDEHDYVAATLRRLRRVTERLERDSISNEQAHLMVGEALERHAEGDIMQTSSFASIAPGDADGPVGPGWIAGTRTPELGVAQLDQQSLATSSFATLLAPPLQPSPLLGTAPARMRRRHRFRLFLRRLFPCFNRPSTPSLVNTPASSFHAEVHTAVASVPVAPLVNPCRPPAFLLQDGFDKSSLPNEFLCPITCAPMTDPVVTVDGHTYERAAIAQWFGGGNRTSPKTGLALTSQTLVPNQALRSQIMTENDRLAGSQ